MNSAIIVAAGIGSRIGGNIPKQFIKIDGKEILSFSVNTFRCHPQIDEIIIVCHKKWMDHVSTYYSDCIVVEGGGAPSRLFFEWNKSSFQSFIKCFDP